MQAVRGLRRATPRAQRRGKLRPPAGELLAHHRRLPARQLRQEFPDDLRRHYWRAKRLWSGPYFADSVGGTPISVLRQYIEQQSRLC